MSAPADRTRTHVISNPTGSTITVGGNSVGAHSMKNLTLSDTDAAAFKTGGANVAQIANGVAGPELIAGYIHE